MHGIGPDEELNYWRERAKRAEEQLAAMTAARDELLGYAEPSTNGSFTREFLYERIAQLRSVGRKP